MNDNLKNKMGDVRNHLVAMMEALNDADTDAETIQRAKALSELAQAYTNTVKVEIDARRMAGVEALPTVLEQATVAPSPMRVIEGSRR